MDAWKKQEAVLDRTAMIFLEMLGGLVVVAIIGFGIKAVADAYIRFLQEKKDAEKIIASSHFSAGVGEDASNGVQSNENH